jgi:hypothetical protein
VPRSSPNSSSPLLLAPILFCFLLNGRCRRIFALNPIPRAAGAITRSLALRHDNIAAEWAVDCYIAITTFVTSLC